MNPARIKHNHYCLNVSICSASLEKHHVPSGLKIKKCLQYLKHFNFCFIRKKPYRQLGSLQKEAASWGHEHGLRPGTQAASCLKWSVPDHQHTKQTGHHTSVAFVTISSCLCSEKIKQKNPKQTSHKLPPHNLSTHPTSALASLTIFLQIISFFNNM